MKRTLAALLAISLLTAAASARAKELASATVCGPSGCETDAHPAGLLEIMLGGPPIAGGPAHAHPFYRLRVVVAEGPTSQPMRLLVVPHGRYVRGPDGAWRQTSATVVSRIEGLAGEIAPFPASQLPGVRDTSPRLHPGTTPAPATATPRPATGGGIPWLAISAAAAGVLAIGVGVALTRGRLRRRSGPRASAGRPRAGGLRL